MSNQATFEPWCRACTKPFSPAHEIVVTLVRDDDWKIRSPQMASLYHVDCFDQRAHPTEVRVIQGYPIPADGDNAISGS
jgi:hypothetical protein